MRHPRQGAAAMRAQASTSYSRFMSEPALPSEAIISSVEAAGGRVTVRDCGPQQITTPQNINEESAATTVVVIGELLGR